MGTGQHIHDIHSITGQDLLSEKPYSEKKMWGPLHLFFLEKTGDLFLLISLVNSAGESPIISVFPACKKSSLLLWGPLFVGAPVRPNMLNMPKSAAAA